MNNDLDKLVKEGLVATKKRAVESFAREHPHFMAFFDKIFAGKKNHVGLRVTEDGKTVGEYTIYMEGTDITRVEGGVLASELHYPLGIIRPYVIVERSTLEKMREDEENIVSNPVGALRKYLPEMTLKFM